MRAQRFQEFADRALLAERGDAHGFQRGFVGRGRNGVEDVDVRGLEYRSSETLNSERLESRTLTIAKARGSSDGCPRLTLLRRQPDPPEP